MTILKTSINLIAFIMLILLGWGCSKPLFINPKGAKFCADVDEACSRASSKLKKKCNLTISGSGGYVGQGIKNLSYYFQSEKAVKLDEAREILLYAIKAYEDVINEDDSIRPYLIEYPFDVSRLEISISFPDMSVQSYGNEYVSHALFYKGILSYAANDHSEKYSKYVKFKKETYEEALKIHSGALYD